MATTRHFRPSTQQRWSTWLMFGLTALLAVFGILTHRWFAVVPFAGGLMGLAFQHRLGPRLQATTLSLVSYHTDLATTPVQLVGSRAPGTASLRLPASVPGKPPMPFIVLRRNRPAFSEGDMVALIAALGSNPANHAVADQVRQLVGPNPEARAAVLATLPLPERPAKS